jgi:hypothetical protein
MNLPPWISAGVTVWPGLFEKPCKDQTALLNSLASSSDHFQPFESNDDGELSNYFNGRAALWRPALSNASEFNISPWFDGVCGRRRWESVCCGESTFRQSLPLRQREVHGWFQSKRWCKLNGMLWYLEFSSVPYLPKSARYNLLRSSSVAWRTAMWPADSRSRAPLASNSHLRDFSLRICTLHKKFCQTVRRHSTFFDKDMCPPEWQTQTIQGLVCERTIPTLLRRPALFPVG